ncbi:STAS domain-containing protein [Streptomyces sp. NPDC026294]|uniref:STAS domain-containing protein n=1 Tax=Streptomyces sp. NPDC026294 TaxID=3155362 RepID=UPI0033FBF144
MVITRSSRDPNKSPFCSIQRRSLGWLARPPAPGEGFRSRSSQTAHSRTSPGIKGLIPNPPRTSPLDPRQHGPCVVATLHGEIDMLVAPVLAVQLARLTHCLQLDVLVRLRQVTFIDGAGIEALAVARVAAIAHEGHLRLLCPLILWIFRHPRLVLGFDVLRVLPVAA